MSDEFRFLGQTIPNLAIISGSILILWGIFAYLSSTAVTSLIPSFVGLPLLILGVLSNKDKSNRMIILSLLFDVKTQLKRRDPY